MTKKKIAERLNVLLLEGRTGEMDSETVRSKLDDAFNNASTLALNVKIANTENTVQWINALVKNFLTGRDVRQSDLSFYCKVMLELLDPDFNERFSFPPPISYR